MGERLIVSMLVLTAAILIDVVFLVFFTHDKLNMRGACPG